MSFMGGGMGYHGQLWKSIVLNDEEWDQTKIEWLWIRGVRIINYFVDVMYE